MEIIKVIGLNSVVIYLKLNLRNCYVLRKLAYTLMQSL